MKENSKNYYEILEVSTDSNQEEITDAYNRAKNAYSGSSIALYSIMTEDECKEILEMVEEAYTILGVPSKRTEYDKARGFNLNIIAKQQEENIRQADNLHELAKNLKKSSEHKKEDFKISKKEAEVSKVAAKNRFSLRYEVDPKFEETIDTCDDFSGEFLKKIREYKGVDVERMSDMTRISKTYIKNIEAEDRDKLPADVYVRGFVYQYAKTLKLNPDLVANSYIQRIKSNLETP